MFGIKIFLALVLQLTRISVSRDTFFLENPGESEFYSTSQEGGWVGWHICATVPEALECLELNAPRGRDLGELLQYFCAVEAKNNLKMFSLHIVLK